MADFSGVRPWMRGLRSKITASSATLPAGELLVDEQGGVYGGSGGVLSALKRLVRVDEVTSAVQQYVSGLVVTNANLTALAAETNYVWAVTDQNGRIAWGVTPDGTTVASKLSLASGSVPQAALASSLQLTLMQPLPVESGYAWAVTDQNGRGAILCALDGTVTMPKFVLPDGSVSVAKLTAAVQALFPVTIPDESSYAWVLADLNGRAAAGVKSNGELVGRAYSPLDLTRTTLEMTGWVIAGAVDASLKHQLSAFNKSTGLWVALGSAGYDYIDPRASADGSKLLYRSNRPKLVLSGPGKSAGLDGVNTGAVFWPKASAKITVAPGFKAFYQALPPVGDGVAVGPVITEKAWGGWGDSLTNGTGGTYGGYKGFFSDLCGLPVVNGGIGGQTSIQIAARANGNPDLITVTGNQIPASGSVAITAQSTPILGGSTTGAVFVIPGTLAGVHGVIQKDASENYTFIRDTAGSAVACPAQTPFVADLGETLRGAKQIFWLGRNNGSTTQARDDTISIVNRLTALAPEFIVMTVINGLSEPGSSSQIVQTLNPALIAAFPNNYVDIRKGLVGGSDGLTAQVLWPGGPTLASAMSYNTLTPTSQDQTDTGSDTVPTSLRTSTPVGTGLALSAANDTVTKTAHGLANNNRVQLANIVSATGVTASTAYYVVGATANTFQLATTSGGSPVDITADGTADVVSLDSIHLNDYGYRYIAYVLDLFRQAKGY